MPASSKVELAAGCTAPQHTRVLLGVGEKREGRLQAVKKGGEGGRRHEHAHAAPMSEYDKYMASRREKEKELCRP